jgi:hypothetical protein
MDPDRAIETLEQDLAQIDEHQTLAHAQLGNRVRDQTLLGIGVRAKPRSE